MTLENAQVNGRLLVVLVGIVGLISGISVIISAVAISKPSKPAITIQQSDSGIPLINQWIQDQLSAKDAPLSNGQSSVTTTPTTTSATSTATPGRRAVRSAGRVQFSQTHGVESWTLAVGKGNGALSDSVSGELTGFHVDVARAVCEAVGVTCHIIYDQPENCWHGDHGGQGLLAGWYDACVGWASTPERQTVFTFSRPHALAEGGSTQVGIMTRKDSPFMSLWQQGLHQLHRTGVYQMMCDSYTKQYGKKLNLGCIHHTDRAGSSEQKFHL